MVDVFCGLMAIICGLCIFFVGVVRFAKEPDPPRDTFRTFIMSGPEKKPTKIDKDFGRYTDESGNIVFWEYYK